MGVHFRFLICTHKGANISPLWPSKNITAPELESVADIMSPVKFNGAVSVAIMAPFCGKFWLSNHCMLLFKVFPSISPPEMITYLFFKHYTFGDITLEFSSRVR